MPPKIATDESVPGSFAGATGPGLSMPTGEDTSKFMEGKETPCRGEPALVNPSLLPTRVNAEYLEPHPMCVGWIDIMGFKNAMLHSLRTAACFVADLHGDIEDARKRLSFTEKDLKIIRLMDGAYVVAEDVDKVFSLLRETMALSALRFLRPKDDRKKSMVRVAVAYGNVVTGADLGKCMEPDVTPCSQILDNVMVGMPFVWSNEGEHRAPPFGIFVHESVRDCTQRGNRRIGWVWDRWWFPHVNKAQGNVQTNKMVGAKGQCLAEQLGKAVLAHLVWLERNPEETGVPSKKSRAYKKLATEYFGLLQNNATHSLGNNGNPKNRKTPMDLASPEENSPSLQYNSLSVGPGTPPVPPSHGEADVGPSA